MWTKGEGIDLLTYDITRGGIPFCCCYRFPIFTVQELKRLSVVVQLLTSLLSHSVRTITNTEPGSGRDSRRTRRVQESPRLLRGRRSPDTQGHGRNNEGRWVDVKVLIRKLMDIDASMNFTTLDYRRHLLNNFPIQFLAQERLLDPGGRSLKTCRLVPTG